MIFYVFAVQVILASLGYAGPKHLRQLACVLLGVISVAAMVWQLLIIFGRLPK